MHSHATDSDGPLSQPQVLGEGGGEGQTASIADSAPQPIPLPGERELSSPLSDRTPIPIFILPLHTVVPGRARLQIGGLRGAPELASLLERGLTGFGGVQEVSASALTGNITIRYELTASLDQLIDRIGGVLGGEITPAVDDPAGTRMRWRPSRPSTAHPARTDCQPAAQRIGLPASAPMRSPCPISARI
jgi:hypothetical protein